ncbi:hypothetical protein PVAND_000044 [Polypedilum vanderplanki]|uniref:Cytochrome P450 n=1 Tax=Polypedilum vanderplanki TaxID=319348 RepID=A0A9J6BK43_POLVA|nr:hypothetical protein PVAND_000044 [Polypedilum vanderplanki]
MVPILAIHHDPLYYPEPNNFDPERFDEEKIRQRPAFTFLPFGDGMRNCIGMRFALLQAKIAIAKLILNFEFSVCDKTTIPIEFNASTPFLTPKSEIYLSVKKL